MKKLYTRKTKINRRKKSVKASRDKTNYDAEQVQKDNKELEETFMKPERTPNEAEKRNMLAKSAEIMIIASLESHVYKFGNELRRQTKGGPIGLALTGEIADCFMLRWDIKFLEKLKSLGIEPAIWLKM